MVVHPDVATLLTLVSAEYGGGEQYAWSDIERALGIGLPSDYKSMLEVYGVGDLGGLNIWAPFPCEAYATDPARVANEISHVRWLWDHDGGVPGVTLGADAVLPWGGGLNAHVLAWLMTGEDPDTWPVLVHRRHVDLGEARWSLFDCGVVQFLTRMMLGQFEECPLDSRSLWQQTKPFVSWREQERRLQAGLDPITGEPDPELAEMVAHYRKQG